MNDELSDINDPQNEAKPEMGRIFTFGEFQLAPFSTGHRNAEFRLSFDGDVSEREATQHLLYMLTLTPMQVDKIRGEGISRFRMESDKWAEVNFSTPQQITDGLKVIKEVRDDIKNAKQLDIQPPKKEPGESPNA